PRRQPGWMLAAGIAGGFVYWISDELIITVGEAGLLPAVVSAWAAPIVLAALSVTVILRGEG
ncbi:MAG: LptF/LptG family permease, partial [Rhodospirillales bacterium]|nr:LptF/LptG family permease [Rhodospirillales bacterium]